jgi:hypothetical protein
MILHIYICIYIYHRVILNLWFYLWVGVLNYFMIVGLFVGFMKLSWVHQRKIWFPKGTRDCVGFRVSYFYWTHWRVAGLLQCSLHSIHRGKPSVRLESSVSPSHVEMTEKKCECGTWGVSWTGGTSNHPILDHVSIETHGFRDPPLKKYNFIQSQHRFFPYHNKCCFHRITYTVYMSIYMINSYIYIYHVVPRCFGLFLENSSNC